jgi:hypothetical protein
MSDLEHFLLMCRDGAHTEGTRADYAARRLAQALVNCWPLLDRAARRGAEQFASMVGGSAAEASKRAGVWHDF